MGTDDRVSPSAIASVMRLVLATFVIFAHSYFLRIDGPATEPLYLFSQMVRSILELWRSICSW